MMTALEKQYSEYALKMKEVIFRGARAGQIYNMTFNPKVVEIYPGIYSNTKQYARFLIELQESLRDALPISSVNDGLFLGSPISSDFSKVKTLSGSIRPLTYSPARDFESEKSHPDVLTMIGRLTRIMFYNDEDVDHPRVSNLSSSGAPLFQNSAESKIQHLNLVSQNISNVKSLLAHGKLRELCEKYGLVFLSTAQIRRQADSWKGDSPKPRKYVSFVSAYTGNGVRGFSEDELIVKVDGIRLGTCRTRVVNAYSGLINNIITSIIAPLRDTAERNFEYTFKHTTQENKIKKLEKFDFYIGLDATQYDANVKYDAVKEWLINLPVNDSFVEMVDLFMRAPFYSSEVQMCDGDVFDVRTFRHWRGLPSGIAFTSIVGKVNMVSHILVAVERALKRKLLDAEIISILKGDFSLGILNMSDDTVICGERLFVKTVFKELTSIMEVEEEKGLAFLGDLFFKDINSNLRAAHNLESYVVNWYVAERSINTKLRPYAMFGAKDRRKIFSDHPLFDKCDSIIKKVFRKHFNDDRDLLEERHMVYPKSIGGALSLNDIEVLTNYEKIFYKYGYSDLSPDVASLFVTSIPLEVSTKLRNAFRK